MTEDIKNYLFERFPNLDVYGDHVKALIEETEEKKKFVFKEELKITDEVIEEEGLKSIIGEEEPMFEITDEEYLEAAISTLPENLIKKKKK
jgi:hypothetical protein